MGLLGNGDDSLTSNTGWGMMPPINSGADWGNVTSSSSSIGANNSGNNHYNTNAAMSASTSSASCWQQPNSLINGGRSSQLVSSSTSASSQHNEQQALSSSPKLSSSWAQAAVKGLIASSSSSNSQANYNNNSSNVIIHSSTNSNAGSVSSVSDRSSISNNGPNNINNIAGTNNNYSHDSYSAAINGGNNQQQQSLNSNGTTAGSSCSSSSSAFQAAQSQPLGANNSSASSSSNENLSGANGGNNKRAINNANIQDIIGNLSDDVRETLLTEKWRSPVINQDSPWNLPPSPQSSPKDTSQWRCPVNSGTEIWENTVRQKKGGPPGGNVGGVSAHPMIGNNGSGIFSAGTPGIGIHGSGIGHVNGPSLSSTAGSSSQPWGQPTGTHSIGGTWGEDEDPSNHWMAPPINPVGNSGVAGGNSSLTSINNWSSNGSNNVSSSSFNNNWNNNTTDTTKHYDPPSEVRSCKTNNKKPWGTFDTTDSCPEQTWEKLGDNFGTWNPDLTKKECGWDKESNDSFKGPVDDGTAVWGNPVRQAKVSNWKDSKFGNNIANNNKNGFNGWNKGGINLNGGGVGTGNTASNGGSHKSNQIPSRTWTAETPQQRKSPLWNDDTATKVNGNCSSSSWLESNSSLLWPDPTITVGGNNLVNSSKPNNKGHGACPGGATSGGMQPPNSWIDTQVDTSHWSSVNNVLPNRHVSGGMNATASGPNQKLSREMIQSSNHFKNLLNMGYKKEDVENALRNNQMRPDDALKELRNIFDDELGRRTNQCALPNDHTRLSSILNAQQNSSTVPCSVGGPVNNPNISSCSNRQTVHLIQWAANTGILNPQILNQPMSKHNLEILNDLLQQVKLLRAIQSNRGDMMSQMKINQIKQNIYNLQNQIHGHIPNSQFVMQSNRGGGAGSVGAAPPPTPPNSIDFFKQNSGGNGNNNTGNDLSSFDFIQQQHTQGSRLHSWKTQYKSDERSSNNDFIRAPGPLSKNSNSSSNNWGGFGGNNDSNWGAEKTELPASLIDDYDFSERFDYNKTWKPPGAKALDDDPRSPLLNLSISKDPFPWNNNKPTMLNSNTDSFGAFSAPANPNTWSYNPIPSQSAVSNMFDLSQPTNKSGPKKSTWGNPLNTNAADYNINSESLWSNAGQDNNAGSSGGNAINKPRPPPGLSGKMSNPSAANNSSVWNAGLSNTPASSSEYLRLRNLTPQIDGSTLKTLCLQHGPLNHFHLSLNHGVAIVRYATRDQAIKAQSALNNCVLGNTTIIADLPSDNEIQQYSIGGGTSSVPTVTTLAQVSQQQQQSTNNLNSLASSWSNGTNASHSHTVAAGGNNGGNNNQVGGSGSTIQSYQTQQQNPQQAAAAQQRVSGQSSSYGSGGSSLMVNSNAASIASSNQTLPYGAGNGSVLSTHSSSLSFRSGGGANHQFNGNSTGGAVNSKLDPTAGWNNPGSIMWDLNNSNPTGTTSGGSGGVSTTTNLWSATGYSTTDRNTPIQNFLPNDLLAGENN